jgi:hypothetical protein
VVGYWGGFLANEGLCRDAQERLRLQADPRYRRQAKEAPSRSRARPGAGASAVVALLTDFGDDYYVGVMKGVLATRAPRARVIDLSHRIAPGRVAEAAYVLASAVPYFPPRTVFCCVVDPGVGGPRRRLAVAHRGRHDLRGARQRAVDADPRRRRRARRGPARSTTALGRAANLRRRFKDVLTSRRRPRPSSRGAKFEAAGPVVTDPGHAAGTALRRFGRSDRGRGRLRRRFRQLGDVDRPRRARTRRPRRASRGRDRRPADRRRRPHVRRRPPPQGPMAYVGSTGHLEIAVRDGNAARELGLGVGADVDVLRG